MEGKLEEAATLYSWSLSKDLTDSNNIRLAGLFARRLGKLDVSVRLLEHALAIDPLCHQCRVRLATSLMYTRDYERARREQERFMAISDDWPDVYAQILLLDTKPREALEYILSIERDEEKPYQHPMLLRLEAMTRHSLGETTSADALLEELIADELFDRRALSFSVAQTAAWLGKKDLAFERLFEMAPTNFSYLKGRVFSPVWDALRDNPRWLEFLAASEMSPERLDAIDFDPDLPE
jgi:tetratricopeptide (TPR) repeat protein